MQYFKDESEFEEALIASLLKNGWESVIKYPTEEDLIKNWADILLNNNKQIDHLNDVPLTDTEMQQLMEKIIAGRTPSKLNEFINGKTTSIIRDNPADKVNFGKAVTLDIYDRDEIAAGRSRYQIVQQPVFKSKSKILNDRRGDLMLLINGLPVIHIELKKNGIPVSQAYHQIEKYSHEGIFSGLFSLIQVFVAMTPTETVYFANPGPDGKFNEDFYFHWGDFNNEPINDWAEISNTLLSIPMNEDTIKEETVFDILIGKNLLGKDLPIEFIIDEETKDLKILTPEQTFLQSVQILFNLQQGDIPEYLDLGIDKDVYSECTNKNDLGFTFPILLRQLSTSLESDDTILDFEIDNIELNEVTMFIKRIKLEI